MTASNTMTTEATQLLREAGAALRRAGCRWDLVAAIEQHVGATIPSEPTTKPDMRAAMARIAELFDAKNEPMTAAAICAAVWPHEPLERARGRLAVALARDWLASGPTVPVPGRSSRVVTYRMGECQDWRDDSVAEQLQAEIARLQAKLASASKAALARGPK